MPPRDVDQPHVEPNRRSGGQPSDHPPPAGCGAVNLALAPAHSAAAPDKGTVVLVVVGSSLHAEVIDRPLAQRLRDEVAARLANEPDGLLRAAICTDLWYLNDRELDRAPVIALGEPSHNAAAAMLCARLPTAMVIEQLFRVHLDPEFVSDQPRAALWGKDASATEAAIDAFVNRYLDGFLSAARTG